MRYIKYDFYVMVYMITQAISNLYFAFSDSDTLVDLDPVGKEYRSKIDKRGLYVGTITVIFLVVRAMQIIIYIVRLRLGKKFDNLQAENKPCRFFSYLSILFTLVMWSIACYYYVSTNYLEDANPVSKTFIFTELIAILSEFPYVAFLTY